ncbi:MAG: ribosome small subunit-dependent GTPase A [Thermoleophilia bacterium]|nr:ribosome small subunit-dependent GTPase A [Thermoleophilia bacterium]
MHEDTSSRTTVRDSLTDSADAAWRARLGEQTLDQLGWTRAVRMLPLDWMDDDDRACPARVVRVDRGGLLLVATGSAPPTRVRARLDEQVVVGDWLLVADDVARRLVPRASLLARRDPTRSTHPQPIAANADVVLVVEALAPDRSINDGRVARIAALARAAGSTPHVVLTNSDRIEDHGSLPATVAGAPATATSIVDGTGIEEVRGLVGRGSTAVLAGASGAGKSSLVNALLDDELLAVGARRGSGTGRHTTATSRLVPVPGGGLLVDTPGVRLVGMHAGAGESLLGGEVEALAEHCRFRDCRHDGEPGCAVAAAVDRGELEAGTLRSLRQLEREARYERARADAGARAELRRDRRARGREAARARRSGEFVERRRD